MKLKLKYPIEYLGEVSVSQGFGNVHSMYTNMGLKGHNGVDFRTAHGQPVYASHDGLASFQIDSGGGCGVVIVTDKEYEYKDDTTLFKTIYWHLCNSQVEPQFKSPFEDKTGFTPVKKGDLVGYADNTGMSTGDHLHWALKPCAKGESWGTFYNTEQNNGYFGCIDPWPFLENDLEEKLEQTQLTLIQILTQIVEKLKLELKRRGIIT